MSLPGKPTIYNLTLTSANTEYSQALPSNTKKLLVKCRTSASLALAFNETESGSTFVTIGSGQVYYEDEINATPTIYLQSPTAGVVAEIIAWSGN